jgi:Domain of unknown function (DUF4430)
MFASVGTQTLGRHRRAGLAATLSLAAVSVAGCGLGAGRAPSSVQLLVTRDFGATVVRSWSAPRVGGQETVMSLLMRNANVTTRYGGGFVESIDGLSGGESQGQPVDWFYYVNGVEARQGAASTNVQPGDHIWWDRHNWSQTDNVPAVVGSFPEPFLNGIGGKRLPVLVECAEAAGSACGAVSGRLRRLGVPAARAALGSGGGAAKTLRVVVAPWTQARGDPALRGIEQGPRASGVYARFSGDGKSLTLLDQNGRAVRTLGPGSGLLAATRSGEDAPVWVVSGTDSAGVSLATRAFDGGTLQGHFAVAVSAAGRQPLPAAGR